MAKKKMDKKSVKPPVNPEFSQAEKEFKRDTFIVEAKPKLKKYALLLWTIIDVGLLVLFIGFIGFYFVSGNFSDRKRVSSIVDNIGTMHDITESRAAEDIIIKEAQFFSLGGDDYDFFGRVENPNNNWYATFSYHFTSAAGDSSSFEGSVMPGETRTLVAIRQNFQNRPNNSELVIEDLVWSRVDASEISDVFGWLNKHNDFVFSDTGYSLDIEIEEEQIARTSFTIKNNSPYSYWAPEFIILVKRASNVSGVNKVTISGLETGETRRVDVNWFGTVPSSGTVEVIPNINYFDTAVYMPLSGETMDDLRDDITDRRR